MLSKKHKPLPASRYRSARFARLLVPDSHAADTAQRGRLKSGTLLGAEIGRRSVAAGNHNLIERATNARRGPCPSKLSVMAFFAPGPVATLAPRDSRSHGDFRPRPPWHTAGAFMCGGTLPPRRLGASDSCHVRYGITYTALSLSLMNSIDALVTVS